ncbi:MULTISPECIES: PCC domain-containing protein [Bradyrhizobium]|uniref:PCC domain-containing protein n=1 Tax=Bradyrhizobium TaxID=374 RepID=UPI00040F915A|nr:MULTISPECIES: DUF296 domain-containing protein [Bradyrhizobium]UFW46356.1 DUF296 domain-containing protein [Bradyrhizobium arachidis]
MTTVRKIRIHRHGENDVVRADQLSSRSRTLDPNALDKRNAVNEQCEVLSLIGDVAQSDSGKASLHLHAVLGLRVGSVRGGHFLSGSVRPTLEVTINETVKHMRRKKRPDLGIALLNL